jgi:hypothetical protein
MRNLLLAVGFLALVLRPLPVRADGMTVVRDATPAEQNFMAATKQSLKDSLPHVPPGWQMEGESDLRAPSTIARGDRETPLELSYSATFRRKEGMEERKATYEKTLEESRAASAKMEALMRVVMEKGSQMDKARAAGNRADYEKYKSELEAAQREYEELMSSAQNPVKKAQAAAQDLTRDTEIKVEAQVNLTYASLSGKLVAVELPGTMVSAYRPGRSQAGSDQDTPAEALVLLGAWKINDRHDGETRYVEATHAFDQGATVAAVHTIAIKIRGANSRIEELVRSLRVESLSRILAH